MCVCVCRRALSLGPPYAYIEVIALIALLDVASGIWIHELNVAPGVWIHKLDVASGVWIHELYVAP